MTYLNLSSIDDLDRFRASVSWPVSEAEKERLFDDIDAACQDLLVRESRPFEQQVLRGVLPFLVSGSLNAVYSGIVMDRVRRSREPVTNYVSSAVDYFSWQLRDGETLPHTLLRRLLAPYLGVKSWVRYGAHRFVPRRRGALAVSSNPTMDRFLELEGIDVDRGYFVEWFRPLATYHARRVGARFIDGVFDRLWAAVAPYGPGDTVQRWLRRFVDENLSFGSAVLFSTFRATRARQTRTFYAATQGYPGTRFISLAVLENGGTVTGFGHTGGYVFRWPLAWMIEGLTNSVFFCYTPIEQQRRREETPAALVGSVADFRLLPQDQKRLGARAHRGPIRSVLYLSGGYSGDRTYTGVLPEVTRFDLELRILDALVANGVRVVVKLHRKSRSIEIQTRLLRARYGDRITIAVAPLTQMLRQGIDVDAFVVENLTGGSLVEVMKTDRPVILFSAAMHFLHPGLADSFRRRVQVIPCRYDDRNRVCFDVAQLAEYLGRDERNISYEFVNLNTNALFEY